MRKMSVERRPHFRRSVGSSRVRRDSRRSRALVAAQALDQLNAGVIITGSCAEVVEINRSAESIVQLEDGLLIRNDRLCAKRTFETGKILKLIAAATVECEEVACAGRMLIGRCDGVPAYVLSAAPLRIGPAVHRRRLAMIVVVDPQSHSPSDKDVGELFGLTPAEGRLAMALLTGKTLAEIAAVTDVRITTLRTQLASVMRKTGAQRQSDLVRILSSTGIGSLWCLVSWLDTALEALQIPLSLAGI
jgi:DNA-binding CsgD family transcriptional regulator